MLFLTMFSFQLVYIKYCLMFLERIVLDIVNKFTKTTEGKFIKKK